METTKLPLWTRILRDIARYGLLVISLTVMVFALLSGSEDGGILRNSPNALPWFVLFMATLYAWKQETFGGSVILILGFAMLYYFNFSGKNFFLSTFILCLLIIILGFFLVVSGYVRKKRQAGAS